MGQVAQGSSYTWPAVLRDAGGALADAADLTLVVTGPTGAVVAGFPVAVPPIVHDATGLYHYVWAVPLTAPLGLYSATWSGILDVSAVAVSGYDSVVVTEVPPIATAAYCTVEQVKQRMSGDVPVVSTAWDSVISDAIAEVSDLINEEVRNVRGQAPGWSFLPGVPVTSRYTGSAGGSSLLLIGDSVAVSSVAILDPQGNLVQTLAYGADWLPWPLNGLPITGLQLLNGVWPWYPGAVQVGRTPGYGTALPSSVTSASIAEVIRAVRAGQAGEDDRLGMTPYGSVVVSKALLQSTMRMVQRYRLGSGLLGGPR